MPQVTEISAQFANYFWRKGAYSYEWFAKKPTTSFALVKGSRRTSSVLHTATFAIDLSTLYLVAALVAATLGALLLLFGQQERISALRWWGGAYLAGAVSVGGWALGGAVGLPLLAFNVIGFLACGLVWTAARVFHGRRPHVELAMVGAAVWIVVGALPESLSALRALIGAGIVAGYAALTANELWRERRKALRPRWGAVVMPVFHASILMMPVVIGEWLRSSGGAVDGTWVVVFAIELVLYAIGTVFIIFMLCAERAISVHKSAALRDPLTGLLNRRGFSEAAVRIAGREADAGRPVSVMIFDLDHFKGINDKFGHPVGDDVLKIFAGVASDSLRATDVIGRIGGEEFAAFLPCSTDEAAIAAERVRLAFQDCGATAAGVAVPTTVSIGLAGAGADMPIDQLLASADKALYRAKKAGRNRYKIATPNEFTDQRGRIAMPTLMTTGEPRKSAIRMPQLLPTLDPETSHLPLRP